MGGIAERSVIGVMRRDDQDRPARAGDPVQLSHRCQHVAHVFDQVQRANRIERIVAERQVPLIQMANHVRRGIRIHIDADRTRILLRTAANVQNAQREILLAEIVT